MGPPGGCFGQGQQPLGHQAPMSACAIECPNNDSINVVAVHIVWLDLQPCIAAIIHLPWGVYSLNDDPLLLQQQEQKKKVRQ